MKRKMSKMTHAAELTLEDVMADPKRYGAPTFQEFCKNPDAWRGKETFTLDSISNGSLVIQQLIKTMTYKIDGYKCRTLEEVEKIALNQGYDLRTLKMVPELEKDTAGKLECIVEVMPKSRYELKKQVDMDAAWGRLQGVVE